jgi:hypothetical protein
MSRQSLSFRTIRTWDGSQHRAFEELSYQLRDAPPSGATETKTGDPDAGLEWYVTFPDGDQWGWQAKYSFDVATLLSEMKKSVQAVVRKRPQVGRLTFCIPIDLPEDIQPGKRKSARQRFDDAVASWKKTIDGAAAVEFRLETAGVLLDRLSRSDNRGKQWFWWEREVFSLEWCARQLQSILAAVGERYSPDLNVTLPIAFALEGLAHSDRFWSRYRRHRGDAIRAGEDIAKRSGRIDALEEEFRQLARAMQDWAASDRGPVCGPTERIDRERLLTATERCRDAADTLAMAAYTILGEHDRAVRTGGKPTASDQEGRAAAGASARDAIVNAAHHASKYARTLDQFASFLRSAATRAAERRALFMTGVAGQGKTHLFCDAAERAIRDGRPALVLLGARFPSHQPWMSIAEQLGLPPQGREVLLGALEAAAEASGGRFLFLIDALNEAEDSSLWRNELRVMEAELTRSGWIGFGVSCRSSYVEQVVPVDGISDQFVEVEHPGFQGREADATQHFFSHFKVAAPRVPFLIPELTNPLFLKLYCESIADRGLKAPPAGHEHLSGVFTGFVESRARRINTLLELDPSEGIVERATQALAGALAEARSDYLPYGEAKALLDGFAPSLTKWPQTLFGALLSEGVLRKDRVYLSGRDERVEAVSFTYQRFSDHLVIAAMLDKHLPADADPAAAFAAGQPLGRWVREAPQGSIEALSVQMPERTGTELLDLVRHEEDDDDWRAERWYRAFLASLVTRDRRAVTDRSRELLNEAQRRAYYLSDKVIETLLAVAPDPEHRLNAEVLHASLMRRPLPLRDATWSHSMYYAWGSETAMGRLVRWAAAGPHDVYDDAVIELAAIPLVWMFTSPNRFARDHVTKALVQLLHARLHVLERLVKRFAAVDDPYVLERLVVCAHGAVLHGGVDDPAAAKRLAKAVTEAVLSAEATPHVLTRDAARGVVESCFRNGLVGERALEQARPPYRSKPPKTPRSREWLEQNYERHSYDDRRPGFGSIFWSVFEDDFGIYVVPRVNRFSLYRLGEQRPEPTESAEPTVRWNQRKYARFVKSLTNEQRSLLLAGDERAERDEGTEDKVKRLLESLTPQQQTLLADSYTRRYPRRSRDKKGEYPVERAKRWIFQRCIELGWEPELFGGFDKYLGRRGRDEHKPERFGKKYQWIALYELLARLADNYQLACDPWDDSPTYGGPWQFTWRDIDPSLPPALPAADDDDVEVTPLTFPQDPPNVWWAPKAPEFRADDLVTDDWPLARDGLPTLRDLIRITDDDDRQWAVVRSYFTWKEEVPEDQDRYNRRRRELWCHLYPWIVHRSDARKLDAFLRQRTLMGRWMPEGGSYTSGAYLGEIPWSEAADEGASWTRGDSFHEQLPVELLPFAAGYLWEASTSDCSVEESVAGAVPVAELFDAARLEWRGGSREWQVDGDVVIQFRETSDGLRDFSALLVREDWLQRVLDAGPYSLVIGLLGEKRFIGPSFGPRDRSPWLELNGSAIFDGKRWSVGKLRVDEKRPAAA